MVQIYGILYKVGEQGSSGGISWAKLPVGYLGSPTATSWVAALLADLHASVCRRLVSSAHLCFVTYQYS